LKLARDEQEVIVFELPKGRLDRAGIDDGWEYLQMAKHQPCILGGGNNGVVQYPAQMKGKTHERTCLGIR